MKIQHLAVIFIIIILPIAIVFSEYINSQMTIIKTKEIYDERLLDSTYDALKAFQLNTINTMYYTPENRVKNIEASANTFFSSLVSAFKNEGNGGKIMKEYVPALLMSMYDGYYIYSPFYNTLTNVTEPIDSDFAEKDAVVDATKPYVSYTCKYAKNGKIYFITYSMENYILVDVFKNNGEFIETRDGYLITGIEPVTSSGTDLDGNYLEYKYDDIKFRSDDYERLSEYVSFGGDESKNGVYYYVVRDGTKYYYSKKDINYTGPSSAPKNGTEIFYIDESLTKHTLYDYNNNADNYDEYYNAIFNNNSAYEYYKNAYNFTKWVIGELGDLTPGDCLDDYLDDNNVFTFSNQNNKIFSVSSDVHLEDKNSNFNEHRREVIRAVITTNLESAIRGFQKFSSSDEAFLMPKISEKDWDLLENNICIATFLQGFRIGGTSYNGYAVVPNTLNKEYVSENDIYILTNDASTGQRYYAKPTEKNISSKIDTTLKHHPGVLKINLEKRQDSAGNYYNPVVYEYDGKNPYLGSYQSIIGSSDVYSINYYDMYRFMRGKARDQDNTTITVNNNLKSVYYKALGRERQCAFKYTDNTEVQKDNYSFFTLASANFVEQISEGETNIIESIKFGTENPVIPTPEPKVGYTFDGWAHAGDPENKIDDDALKKEISKKEYNRRDYVAIFEPVEYNISIDLNGGKLGTETGTITRKYTIKDAFSSIAEPIRDNYRFIGWKDTNSGVTTPTIKIDIGSTGNRSFQAQWESSQFTIIYYNGSTEINRETYNQGQTLTIKNYTGSSPTGGWSFYGWTEDEVGTTRQFTGGQSGVTTYSDRTGGAVVKLYAIFVRNINVYSGISRNASTTRQQFVNLNTSPTQITLPSITPILDWYIDGYRDDTTADRREHSAGESVRPNVNNTVTYYAVYSRTLTINYNANGGTGVVGATTKTIYLNTDSTTTSPQAVTLANGGFVRSGYTFGGWGTTSSGGTIYSGGTSYNPNLAYNAGSSLYTRTLYAKWTQSNYEVSGSGFTTQYTATLADAVSKVPANGTIKALASISDTSNVSINKNITFNLNGKTITRINNPIYASSGTLTITGPGTIYASSGTAINSYNNAALVINNGAKINANTGTAVYSNSTGKIEITDSYVYVNNEANNSALDKEAGNLKITRSWIYSPSGNALTFRSTGTLDIINSNICGGSINNSNPRVAIEIGGSPTVQNTVNITGSCLMHRTNGWNGGGPTISLAYATKMNVNNSTIYNLDGGLCIQGSSDGIKTVVIRDSGIAGNSAGNIVHDYDTRSTYSISNTWVVTKSENISAICIGNTNWSRSGYVRSDGYNYLSMDVYNTRATVHLDGYVYSKHY